MLPAMEDLVVVDNVVFEGQLLHLENQPTENWVTNDVVLDCIFGFLDMRDLISLRFSSKQFSRAAGRALARKAVVRLTSKRLAGERVSVENTFHRYGWACMCQSEDYELHPVRGQERYFSVDHVTFRQEPVWDSHFRPKRVSILGCSCVYELPMERFGLVEELEITIYRESYGIKLLQDVAILFPNLNHFEAERKKPYMWLRNSGQVPPGEDESTGAAGPYDEAPLSPDQCTSALKLPLRSLSFEVSPHSTSYNWEILKYFNKLQTIQINWCYRGRLATFESLHGNYYGNFLQALLPHLQSSATLNQAHFMFQLTLNNCESIQTFLNQLTVKNISLHLAAIRGTPPELICDFLSGLHNRTKEALNRLCFGELQPIESLFALLHQMNFLRKFQWTIEFRGLRIEKTAHALRVEACNENAVNRVWKFHDDFFDLRVSQWRHFTEDFFRVMRKYQLDYNVFYNYGFYRFESFNSLEILNANIMFNPELVRAGWTRLTAYSCDNCRSLPRLMCDLPEFRKEANIILPPHRNLMAPDTTAGHGVWTFLVIPFETLEKWKIRLNSCLEDMKAVKRCNCRCWDLMETFAGTFPWSFNHLTRRVQDGEYPAYSIYDDPLLKDWLTHSFFM